MTVDLCELLMLYLDNARGAHPAQPSPKVEIPVRECPPYIPPPARVVLGGRKTTFDDGGRSTLALHVISFMFDSYVIFHCVMKGVSIDRFFGYGLLQRRSFH